MVLTKVQSSNVQAVGCDASGLVVLFRSGGAYRYPTAGEKEFTALLAAPSKGAWLQQHLVGRPQFPVHKLTSAEIEALDVQESVPA